MTAQPQQYTWLKTWEFFLLGIGRAIILTLGPVAFILGKWAYSWGDYPVDWSTVWGLALAAGTPAAALYWKNHRHLLKLPPSLIIPDEFLQTDPKLHTVTESRAVTVPTDAIGSTRTVTVEDKHIEPAPTKKGE